MLTCTILLMTMGSMLRGKRRMLKRARDTKAFWASSTFCSSTRTYTAKVDKATCKNRQQGATARVHHLGSQGGGVRLQLALQLQQWVKYLPDTSNSGPRAKLAHNTTDLTGKQEKQWLPWGSLWDHKEKIYSLDSMHWIERRSPRKVCRPR